MKYNKLIRKRLTTLIVTAAMSLSCFTPMTVHAETTAGLNPVPTTAALSLPSPNILPLSFPVPSIRERSHLATIYTCS